MICDDRCCVSLDGGSWCHWKQKKNNECLFLVTYFQQRICSLALTTLLLDDLVCLIVKVTKIHFVFDTENVVLKKAGQCRRYFKFMHKKLPQLTIIGLNGWKQLCQMYPISFILKMPHLVMIYVDTK